MIAQKLEETESKIQGTVIANIKSAKQTWICFVVRDDQLHAREGEEMLNSTGLRSGKDGTKFGKCLQGQRLSASEKNRSRGRAPLAASPHLVYEVLHKTRGTVSGKDGIPAWVFCENAQKLTFPLKHILDDCLAQVKFSACLKKSEVIPLPKDATPGSLNHLKPIAITGFMSRIMETVSIKNFVVTNYDEKVEARQPGFWVGEPTENVFIQLQCSCILTMTVATLNQWDLTTFGSSLCTFQRHWTEWNTIFWLRDLRLSTSLLIRKLVH